MSAPWEAAADVVIVGSGVAGLSAALEAAGFGLRTVAIVVGEAPATHSGRAAPWSQAAAGLSAATVSSGCGR